MEQMLTTDALDEARALIRAFSESTEKQGAASSVAALLVLGPDQAFEVALGELARQANYRRVSESDLALWLAAALARTHVPSTSPARVSMLAILAQVANWRAPVFALMAPGVDQWINSGLENDSAMVREQTVDFLATWSQYWRAPRRARVRRAIRDAALQAIALVDDSELAEDWESGLRDFSSAKNASLEPDSAVWSAPGALLAMLSHADPDHADLARHLSSATTGWLAELASTNPAAGKLVGAVRVEGTDQRLSWSQVAGVISVAERFVQEVADRAWKSVSNLPTFVPAAAAGGSWTVTLSATMSTRQAFQLVDMFDSLGRFDDAIEASDDLREEWQRLCAEAIGGRFVVYFAVASAASDVPYASVVASTDGQGQARATPLVLSRDVPQADTLARVVELTRLFVERPGEIELVRERFISRDGITGRQFSYYRRASETLGLLTFTGHPTRAGALLARVGDARRSEILRHQFSVSEVGAAWLRWAQVDSVEELHSRSAFAFVRDVAPSLSESTARRRSRTLVGWLEELTEAD
ncbi:MAG: hypothetical protein RMA76_26110 [Deltaproteobacteria bacterium]